MNTPLPVVAGRFRAACASRLIVPILPVCGRPLVVPVAVRVPVEPWRVTEGELAPEELPPRLYVGPLELPPSLPREGAELAPRLPLPPEEGALRPPPLLPPPPPSDVRRWAARLPAPTNISATTSARVGGVVFMPWYNRIGRAILVDSVTHCRT